MDSQTLYRHACRVIPGGTQLLSKRPEMFLPEHWPTYYTQAKGANVTDIEGNTYLDMSYCGIGATVLGFADPDVNDAVKSCIDQGAMSTLNCPEEIELADLLIELTPWAEMARFSRSGGEALSIAIRIARAQTGREKIAFCGYHGWHDWYLSANLSDSAQLDDHLLPGLASKGVPRGLAGLTHAFQYNDIHALQSIGDMYGDQLAAIVLEPVRGQEPEPDFVAAINEMARKTGAVLIIDEVTAGFRLNTGGAHLLYGYEPDMAVFAKALGNGFPIAAIVGKRNVMQAAQETFISSTTWTERVGPVAALATLRKHRKENVAAHLIRLGDRIKEGWLKIAKDTDLDISVSGIAPLGHFSFKRNPTESKTLFTQEMLDRGILATTSFYTMFSHTDDHVDHYLEQAASVFAMIAEGQERGDVSKLLRGPVVHTGFHRLTG